MQRRRKAAFGDESSWSDTTRVEVERHIRRFQACAKRARQNVKAPDERWFVEHIQNTRQAKGVGYVRKYARNLGHHFRRHGTFDLSNGPRVRAVLRSPGGTEDVLSLDFNPSMLPFSLGRAQIFADEAYTAQTHQQYTLYAKRWIARCRSADIDPLDPTVAEIVQYFEDIAALRAPNTVINNRNALSHYFRKNHVPDPARCREVARVIEGLKRTKKPRQVRPVTPDVRRRLLASLEDEGVGVRDRVAILLVSFSKMSYERMALIDAEHCTVTSDGVAIRSLGDAPPVFIGAHPEHDLNIVRWMGLLLNLVPTTGPLFRPIERRRMRFGDRRITLSTMIQCVSQAAENIGESKHNLARRLQALFEAEAQPHVSAVALAYHANRVRLKPDKSADGRQTLIQVKIRAAKTRKVRTRTLG